MFKKKPLKTPKTSKSSKIEIPQKIYVLITLEEKRAREAKYNSRLNDLRAVLNFYDEALRELEKQEDARRIQEEWLEYLACEGLPKPNSPPEIRLFFLQKRYVEAEIVKNTLDWQLNVDERSILNQDIFRKDMTRAALNKVLRPEFGTEYNQCIDDALKILRRIQKFLDDEKMVSQVSERVLRDIREFQQPLFIQQEILDLFNRYTYRILSSEASYMEHVDDIAAEYRYSGNNFAIHIWALKHVPIIFNPVDFPSILADLSEINAQLQIPFSVLRDDISIRSIHFKFDHFSEHTKSFNQRPNIPPSSINAMIPDLSDCLSHEWEMQMELENEVRNHMILLRTEYEEKLKLIEEENARKQKAKKNQPEDRKNAKVKPPKKPPKEQPLITDNTYPDIWEDFLAKEQKDFDDFIDVVYHPNMLNLNSFEVNMKEYIILGGVYQIIFVQKPDHTSFSSFTMTWHAHNGNLYIDKDVKADLEVDYAKLHRTKIQRFTTGITARYSEAEAKRRTTLMIMETFQKSMFGSHIEHHEADEDASIDKFLKDVEVSPYFVITLDLPSNLCLWGEPQPCHFEADIASIVETAYPEAETRENLRYARATIVEQDMYNIVNQMPSLHVPTPSNLTLVGGEQNPNPETGLSRLPSFAHSSEEKKPTVGIKLDGVELKDFNINLPMSKGQIRTMQRHCIPRIISSLKFPIEQAEEETEESRTKPKGIGGTLVRRRQSEGEDKDGLFKHGEHHFSYRLQNNPERFFPIFSRVENVQMPFTAEDYAAMVGQFEPETFFELLYVLDNLKKIYQDRYKALFDLPLVMPKKKKRTQPTGPPPIEAPSIIDTKAVEEKPAKKTAKKAKGGDKADKPPSEKGAHRGTRFLETREVFDDYEYDEQAPSEAEEVTYAHWTKKHIYHSVFNRKNRKLMIWTDRVGTIGLAFKRYEHFPFRYWSLEPREDDPEKGVIFRIHTQFAKCVIFISPKGYSGYVTSLTAQEKNIRSKEKYFEIKEPIRELRDLKRLLSENNLNIFSQEDARYYIENGYFCEKHLATENHCYTCMAVHCALLKFRFSEWNRFAFRREIILSFLALKESEENMNTARITPEGATFVEIREKCDDNLQNISLEYTLTWKNLDNYSDLHNMIMSTYPAAIDMRVKEPNLLYFVRNFLREIRPLSYS